MSVEKSVFLNIIIYYYLGYPKKIHHFYKIYVLEVLILIGESGYLWIRAVEFHIKWIVFFEIERAFF